MSAQHLSKRHRKPGEPPNNEMQRTSHGQGGGSPLISVFDGLNAVALHRGLDTPGRDVVLPAISYKDGCGG